MKGVVSTLDDDTARLVEKARAWQGLDGRDLVREITCAAEFEAHTPYLYSSYETEDEARPTDKPKVMILGSGPNRIGRASSSITVACRQCTRCARWAMKR